MPPDCTTRDGNLPVFTSKSRRIEAGGRAGAAAQVELMAVALLSAAVGVAVAATLLLLGVVAAVLALLWKRRKIPM